MKNRDFLLEKNLSLRDVPFAKKLYEQFKDEDSEKISLEFANQRHLSEIKIEKFLKTQLDEKVVPINQIDNNLVNKIYDIIPNHADCKILASAMQLQSTRAIFLFVTADGKDLDPNGYEYLKEHFEINYSEEKYKFPEFLNLMFTN
jgi:DNA-directed RNA polymerase subunit F